MKEKPVTCPICGDNARVIREIGEGYCVIGSGCGQLDHYFIVGYFSTRAAAIAAWNRAMRKERRK
jgi:hypothetical protein